MGSNLHNTPLLTIPGASIRFVEPYSPQYMRLPPVRVPPIDLVPVYLPLLTQTSMLVVRSQSF
jgi:hypothetical protein